MFINQLPDKHMNLFPAELNSIIQSRLWKQVCVQWQ